jgi:membrane protein
MRHKLLTLFQVALTDFFRNNCPYMAAGIAYWALFSLFPLALAGISIIGFLYPTPEEQRPIVEGIVRLIPVSTEYLADLIGEVVRARGTLGVLAIVGLLWTGTAVFSAARKGINHAWHIRVPHYFLLERAIDTVMLLSVALLAFILVAFTTNAFGLATMSRSPDWLAGGIAGRVLLEIVALAVTFGVFLLLYRFVPNTQVRWRDTWLGALLGCVMFQGARVGFNWFAANFSSFALVYGSLGAVMAVLAWAYLSSIALIWGAQVTYTFSRVLGSRATIDPIPELQFHSGRVRKRQGFVGMIVTVASWLLPPKRRDE